VVVGTTLPGPRERAAPLATELVLQPRVFRSREDSFPAQETLNLRSKGRGCVLPDAVTMRVHVPRPLAALSGSCSLVCQEGRSTPPPGFFM
jgi:hypothetical protein